MQRPSRPAPPKPVPKPGNVKVVRALYSYAANLADELSFDEGDILYITDISDKDWWKAKLSNGKAGLVPSNYVEENMESMDNPMHDASKRGNVDFLNECIRNRVSVNALDKAGSVPLHWAAHGGHIPCITVLFAVPNCQVDVQNKLGDTPLHSAAWKSHPDAVKMLLDKGARIDIKNNDGKTPFELAKDPMTAALLKAKVRPRGYSTEYGDEEDSD